MVASILLAPAHAEFCSLRDLKVDVLSSDSADVELKLNPTFDSTHTSYTYTFEDLTSAGLDDVRLNISAIIASSTQAMLSINGSEFQSDVFVVTSINSTGDVSLGDLIDDLHYEAHVQGIIDVGSVDPSNACLTVRLALQGPECETQQYTFTCAPHENDTTPEEPPTGGSEQNDTCVSGFSFSGNISYLPEFRRNFTNYFCNCLSRGDNTTVTVTADDTSDLFVRFNNESVEDFKNGVSGVIEFQPGINVIEIGSNGEGCPTYTVKCAPLPVSPPDEGEESSNSSTGPIVEEPSSTAEEREEESSSTGAGGNETGGETCQVFALKSLGGVTLNPPFETNITEYTWNISDDAPHTFTAKLVAQFGGGNNSATLVVNGQEQELLVSGVESGSIFLNAGANLIEIDECGTYTIICERQQFINQTFYAWFTGAYSQCTAECPATFNQSEISGTFLRTVRCMSSEGEVVDDDVCAEHNATAGEKPEAISTCTKRCIQETDNDGVGVDTDDSDGDGDTDHVNVDTGDDDSAAFANAAAPGSMLLAMMIALVMASIKA